MICFFINIKKSIPLFRPEYVYRPDSGNSGDSSRNKLVHSPEFFMTCSVPVFGTNRNIPAGTERNLEPWFSFPSNLFSNKNIK